MKVRKLSSSTGYQAYLHLALHEAVCSYEETQKEMSRHPPLTEENATPELTLLHYRLEQRRATVLVLAACCVEAVANLYLGHKSSPEQFALLERASFMDKWTVVPSLFLPNYSLPSDGELYQDLKRLNGWRNALVHLKEDVTREGVEVHSGSRPRKGSDDHRFVGRCRGLPDRLLSHLASFDNSGTVPMVRMVSAIGPILAHVSRLTTA